MKLMTVKEYAKHIGKSIPLVYKQIANGQVRTELKYGVYLIKVKWKQFKGEEFDPNDYNDWL